MTDKSRDDGANADTNEDARPAPETTRRRVMRMAGATGVVGGLSGLGVAQTQDGPVEIRLSGDVEGWTPLGGFEADFIGEGPNPTLNLDAGQEYEVFWRNPDGLPHNFAIIDAQGDYLVRSDVISEEGATQTVTFTASEAMTAYLCEVHPNSMRGDVSFAGGAETPDPAQVQAGFFEEGARVGAQVVAEGMTAPTDFAEPDDGTNRQFVTDQTGEVWVVTDEGRQEEPFVNVSDRMVELGQFYGDYADPNQEYDERGLLGIALHPEFASNGRYYLHYSAPPDGVDRELPADNWDHWEVLSEFTASQDRTDGRPDSERRLLEIPSPQYNHDAGPFGFDDDGNILFPMGDGGGANDNMYGHVQDWYERNGGGNGQDVTENLMGSVLRIDPDESDGDRPYGIPDDNPFVGTQALPEIWAYGFRNPYGFSIDSEGNVFVADAGQNLYEEVDVVESGGNYGWNVKEGTHCFSSENPSDPAAIIDCPRTEPTQGPYDGSELEDPIVEFPHEYRGNLVGITIVGGHRYEQSTVADLEGKYVYGVWTQDPTRREPEGRVLTAEPPAGFGAGDADAATETAAGTQPGANETAGTDANATAAGENATAATGANATAGDENATAAGGNETAGDEPAVGDVPRDELWEMRELTFAGTEGGSLPYFVRMFGRGADGEIYVLVNSVGVPDGDTGRVLQIVPPEEGEDLTPATDTTPVEDPGGEPGDVGTETGEPTGNRTGNETGNQMGNRTGNQTGD